MKLLLEGVLAFCLLPTLALVPWTTYRTAPNNPNACWQHLQKPDANTVPGFRIKNTNNRQRSVCYLARSATTKKRKRRRTTKWDIMIPRLEEYYRQHGHSLITEQDEDTELYEWTRQLRYMYIHQIRNTTSAVGRRYRRRLSKEKLDQLESLEFVWELKPQKASSNHDSWDRMIHRLKRFQEAHGHTKVTNEDDSKLFQWCKYILYNYGHQASNSTSSSRPRPRLTRRKLKELEEIGFDWGNPRQQVRRWDLMFPRLQAFHETNGHVNVTPAEDLELYQWMNQMRNSFQVQALNMTTSGGSRPRLAQAKLDALNEMGFHWEYSTPPRASWEERYKELCKFKKKNGHCYVPSTENKALQAFCNKQRDEFRKYKLGNATSMTEERIELLNKIQFEWVKPHERTWEERRAELEDYWKRTGESHVPQDYHANKELGQWCMNQRTFYRMNKNGDPTGLTSERIRKLEKLEFQWKQRQLQWRIMFERLQSYQKEKGTLDIPTEDFANEDLRLWLNIQRFNYRDRKAARMTQERINLLESLPDFVWERKRSKAGPSKKDWEKMFVAIREKGIRPEARAKQHWFDGVNRFQQQVKTDYTEEELLALWNEETEDEEDEDGDEFYEDEETSLFLRA